MRGNFDDLVGERDNRRRLKAQPLGGAEVDHQLKLGWCLHREVRGLGALEDAVNVSRRLSRLFD